jgi:hypothetical protein
MVSTYPAALTHCRDGSLKALWPFGAMCSYHEQAGTRIAACVIGNISPSTMPGLAGIGYPVLAAAGTPPVR